MMFPLLTSEWPIPIQLMSLNSTPLLSQILNSRILITKLEKNKISQTSAISYHFQYNLFFLRLWFYYMAFVKWEKDFQSSCSLLKHYRCLRLKGLTARLERHCAMCAFIVKGT